MLTSATDSPRASTEPCRRTCTDVTARSRLTADLFERVASCTEPSERARLIQQIIEANLEVADALARRFASRGLPLDDLSQEARLGLVRAAQTFEPDLGHDFLAFAVPSIVGTLRKLFRDSGWSVRPPRRVQEAHLAITRARPEIIQELGREPTVRELSERVGIDADTVIEALDVDSCYSPASLDKPVGNALEGATEGLSSLLSAPDSEFDRCEARVVLRPILASLSPRDQAVISMRFFEELTQREIGERIGVSQMQVSRILTSVLKRVRDQLGEMPADLFVA